MEDQPKKQRKPRPRITSLFVALGMAWLVVDGFFNETTPAVGVVWLVFGGMAAAAFAWSAFSRRHADVAIVAAFAAGTLMAIVRGSLWAESQIYTPGIIWWFIVIPLMVDWWRLQAFAVSWEKVDSAGPTEAGSE